MGNVIQGEQETLPEDGEPFDLTSDEIIKIYLDSSLGRPSDLPTEEHKRCRARADKWHEHCKKMGWVSETPHEVE